jgi:hypothetical protein
MPSGFPDTSTLTAPQKHSPLYIAITITSHVCLFRLWQIGSEYRPSRTGRSDRHMRPTACIIAACASVPATHPVGRHLAPSIVAGASSPTLQPSNHPATSLGLRCAIATSTATIRVPVDHPTIDHRERLWDRARKIAPHHLRFFYKNESNLTRSSSQRLGRTRLRRRRALPLCRTMRDRETDVMAAV